MKKITKMTALLLTASIALTSCSAPFDLKNDKKEEKTQQQDNSKDESKTQQQDSDPGILDSIFGIFDGSSNVKITAVTDEPYTLNGREGRYTGDWKGDRPEGKGSFYINDSDFYEGEWSNGKPYGNVVVQSSYAEGSYIRYEGVYADNSPAGVGKAFVKYADGYGYGTIEGDFSDHSTLLWYSFDENGFPTDIGCVSEDGEDISYVENPDKGGIDYKEQGLPYLGFDESGPAAARAYVGKYYGQTDENGLADGYGYFYGEVQYRNCIEGNDVIYFEGDDDGFYEVMCRYFEDKVDNVITGNESEEELTNRYGVYVPLMKQSFSLHRDNADNVPSYDIEYLGMWDHGKLTGKYSRTFKKHETGEVVETEMCESDKNGELTGEYIFISTRSYGHRYMHPYLSVTTQNLSTIKDYYPDENGVYRGSDIITEEHYEDGGYGIFDQYYVNSKDTSKAGRYVIYDANGNVQETGGIYGDFFHSDEDIAKYEKIKREDEFMFNIGITITALALYGAIKWSIEDDKRFNTRMAAYREASKQATENEYKFNNLMKDVKNAYSSGNYSEAEKLCKQAKEIPIICLPSGTDLAFS